MRDGEVLEHGEAYVTLESLPPGVKRRDLGHGYVEVSIDGEVESLFRVPREERREGTAPGYVEVTCEVPEAMAPLRRKKKGRRLLPPKRRWTPQQQREGIDARNEKLLKEEIERRTRDLRADLERVALQQESATLTRKIGDFVRRSPRKR